MSDQDLCPVCYEPENEADFLPCLHKLCNKCKSSLVNPICPLCRHPIGTLNEPPATLVSSSLPVTEADFTTLESRMSIPRRRRRRRRRLRGSAREVTSDEPDMIFNMEDVDLVDNFGTMLSEETKEEEDWENLPPPRRKERKRPGRRNGYVIHSARNKK